jgi:cytochrome c-type biogenesis protein
MSLLILAFLAGVLTIAAPCILPLLPVVVGGSISPDAREPHSWRRPLVITGSLVVSVIVFSLLLKATTALLGVPQVVWQAVSGLIVLTYGWYLLWPAGWERLSGRLGLSSGAQGWLSGAAGQRGYRGEILLGAALGPVFNSCSPTYALIVAVLLPASFATGLAYLSAYALGLGLALLAVAAFGRAVTSRLGWYANPDGQARKVIGVVFVLVGLFVLLGVDKTIQTFVLEHGWYDPVSGLEERLR